MKERKLSDKKIINELTKKSFIEIAPICNECVLEVINLVMEIFTDVHCNIFQVEDEIYCLRISV